MLQLADNLIRIQPLPTPAANSRIDFFDLDLEEAEEQVGKLLGKSFHGRAFSNFVCKHRILDPERMTSLPIKSRSGLKESVDLSTLPIRKRLVSRDGTVKFLLEVATPKGPEEIECVYIPEEERVTLCVSSQVGCKMGCKFCLTAQLGFKSHLSAGQIVRQYWTVSQDPELKPITNIVFMGMGEPFDNFENVKRASRILTHPRGINLSAKKITVSTVGNVEKMDQIQKSDPFRLAVSLNSTRDEIRSQIMPINNRWRIGELMAACSRYARRTNKRITFEYILMKGVSDSREDAKRLISLVGAIPSKINLIPYNESPLTEFKRPSDEVIADFHRYLVDRNISAFTRKNRGNDIYAACGMLRKLG